MTHQELVERAGAWLRSQGCTIALEELVALVGEVPDALGWRDSGRLSYLIECKAHRGDFLADKRKPHREKGGLGTYRFYMCPPGLIRREELPDGWGLLYAHPKKVEFVCGKHPKRWAPQMNGYYNHADRTKEIALLYSALNRLRIDLGDQLFRERVHKPYTERQASPRRFVIFD